MLEFFDRDLLFTFLDGRVHLFCQLDLQHLLFNLIRKVVAGLEEFNELTREVIVDLDPSFCRMGKLPDHAADVLPVLRAQFLGKLGTPRSS